MISAAEIIATATAVENGFDATIPPSWMQGRTSYGGLSAALALEAARTSAPDLPPLRSVQIAFVGPLGGAVSVRATLLRRGRTAAFIRAEVSGEAGLGLVALFAFMTPIESRIAHDDRRPAPHPAPAAGASGRVGPAGMFFQNFEYLDVTGADAGPAETQTWTRLRARTGLDPLVELIAVGDALPPAALRLIGNQPVPLSTLTWTLNILDPAPVTANGWWLLGARADSAQGGSSGQRMAIWNSDGALVAEGVQSVAIFA